MPVENRLGEFNRRLGGLESTIEALPHIIGAQIGQQVQQLLATRTPNPAVGFPAPPQRPPALGRTPLPPPAMPSVGELADPELQALFSHVDGRMSQTDQRVERLLQLIEKQNEAQEIARGQQMAADLGKDFSCFADPDLGPNMLAEFTQARRARPWLNPASVAQTLQERYERLVTRIAGGAVRPPTPPAPGAAVVPGGGPPAPVVATTAPVGSREAGRLVAQALSAPAAG